MQHSGGPPANTYLIIDIDDLLCHHQKSKIVFLLRQSAPL